MTVPYLRHTTNPTMKRILLFVALTAGISSYAQINMEDSTAQVVAYLNKGETQSYALVTDKYKINGSDTTSHEQTTYDVEVTVLDSTENSYTIEWLYHNVNTNNNDPLVKRFQKVAENMKVIYKTDELGSFVEVVNWKDLVAVMAKATADMKKEFRKLPGADKVIDQLMSVYATKEGIETGAIKEIQQFHSYHGAKYKLGELLETNLKVPNMFGGQPFDAEATVYLDEINEEDNNFIMRYIQSIDPEQLTNETRRYLSEMSKAMKQPESTLEELGPFINEITNGTRVHGSGWIIYSIQTKTVMSGDITNVEETVIEIK